ncbi:MAG: DNA polymerase III subunit alpha [Eubacteriales bacterium]
MNNNQAFVHLHLHSEYSLLDGACRLRDIAAAVKAAGQSAVALTDHGSLYGAVAFWRACTEAGVKPIIGCEVYVAPRSRHLKEGRADAAGYHLVLLVENETGYKNLCKLVSLGYIEGFYSKPRIDLELLTEYHEGLIALSACMAGYIPSMILAGDMQEAVRYAKQLSELFGRDRFYLELQHHKMADDDRVCGGIRMIAAQTGIPLVATNDVHYLKKEDARTQAILMCIQTNNVITDGRPIGFETDEYYLKSTAEMAALFGADKDALANTVKIADRCQFSFTFGTFYLPTFPPEKGKTHAQTLIDYTMTGFEEKVREGHITFDGKHPRSAYIERLRHELSVIDQMGFNEYFLIVQDFVRFAKRNGIAVGPGRGSGAGSLVAYCLSITDVDSLAYELLFERFLNPERISLPDFDIDFCYEQRDRVMEYVREKYGEEHVAQIITFGTMAAKAAVRDVGRALGMPYAQVDRVAKAVPGVLGITIADALQDKGFRALYDSSDDIKELIDVAAALEGMPRHASTHAAGLLITERPLWEYVPLSVNNGLRVTAYDMNTIADLGLVKFDFLGLRYLTVLAEAERSVREREPDFLLSKVPFTDPDTYGLLSAADTDGVFQLESAGMKQVLQQLKPSRLEDIIACIALYRPGPMESIHTFIARKTGAEPIVYATPALEDILSNTYGCIVYQEQVMQIFRRLAGYSYARADLVRRAMSKKKAEAMEAERGAFIEGAVAGGIDRESAGRIFDDMAGFAKYAFNKSHSTAYAMIAYRTAYMKCHYPAQYVAALLSSQQTADLGKFGVKLLPPDVNQSGLHFSVADGGIRFSLLAVKNVGRQFIEAMIAERTHRPFAGFEDFVERMAKTDLNKRQIEALIKCGAFDSLGVYRSRLMAVYERVIADAQARARANLTGQMDFFSTEETAAAHLPTIEYPQIPEYTVKELLTFEKEATGMYFSGHLLDSYSRHLDTIPHDRIATLTAAFHEETGEALDEYADRQAVTLCGMITAKSVKHTKKGGVMAFLTLMDKSGDIELIVFPAQYDRYAPLLEVDAALCVEGNLSVREGEKVKVMVSRVLPLLTNAVTGTKPAASPAPRGRVDGNHPAVAPVSTASAPQERAGEQKLYLKLPSLTSPLCQQTLQLLSGHPGRVPVVFFDSLTHRYSLAAGYMIRPTADLLAALKELLGEAAVALQ